jgi:hypothetical protein
LMPTVQGFVQCDVGSLWLVIIPKSKDQFRERPPMKTVQPVLMSLSTSRKALMISMS